MAKVETTGIHTGGLFRCCVREAMKHTHEQYPEGAKLQCRHCGGRMTVEDGMWRWDQVQGSDHSRANEIEQGDS